MHFTALRQHHGSLTGAACRHQHRRTCCVQVSCSQSNTTPTAAAANSDNKTAQQQLGRRAALTAALLPVVASTALPSQASVSSDLLEGTQNMLSIGRDSLGLWVQSAVDGVFNGDDTGITDLDNLDDSKPRRRFGSISVPGLSSFSFIHGALVGGAVILLLAADKLTPQQQLQQQHPALKPEVEAALKQLLASPEVKAQFHDPAVHAALQEVRVDPRAIAKYRDDPVVMQAFSKLLEIENILERL